MDNSKNWIKKYIKGKYNPADKYIYNIPDLDCISILNCSRSRCVVLCC